jgi:hypothetical protein
MNYHGGWPVPIWQAALSKFAAEVPFRIERAPRQEVTAWLNPYTKPDRYLRGILPTMDVLTLTVAGLSKPVPQVITFDQKPPPTGVVWPANPFLPKQ